MDTSALLMGLAKAGGTLLFAGCVIFFALVFIINYAIVFFCKHTSPEPDDEITTEIKRREEDELLLFQNLSEREKLIYKKAKQLGYLMGYKDGGNKAYIGGRLTHRIPEKYEEI